MSQGVRFALVLLCFFLSGFAALIYQTAWTREFAFVFGTSELAIATVLASYMGGLAAGAAVASRAVRAVRRPVLVYGLLELGIALSALAVPWALRAVDLLFVSLFRGSDLGESGQLATALFFLLSSFAILLVPTGLMGATLPMLTRYAVHREEQIGSRVSALYATNTFGAVLGALSAGFVLLPALGLRETLWVAVGANALVFGAAVFAARGAEAALPAPESAAFDARAARGRWVLPLMLVSGAVSFSYEVMWSRLLGHLLGGSVYGFSTMLASFLAGIALGSAIAARFARDAVQAARAFAAAQLGTAGLSTLAFFALDRMPALSHFLTERGADPLLADAAVAAATLLPAALCIGATFPLAVRVLARSEADAGPASARVYAWNTVGAIVGSIATGFFLLPALQYQGLVTLAVCANLALALCALAASAVPRALAAGIALTALVGAALVLPPSPPWRLLRASAIAGESRGATVYFGVGRSATVLLAQEGAGWRLRTNGLPESMVLRRGSHVPNDSLTQWLGAGASLARPEARHMLVIGFGGGVVLEAVPPLIESIDVVELEPEVIRANRFVAERRRRDPLSDPRVRIVYDDARGALQRSEKRYDIIASQPSHPWTGGASHLYTREFFALARERLTPDGVLAQWMAQAFVDEELLRALVASLVAEFPHVSVYRPTPSSLLLLASPQPLRMGENAARAIAAAPDDYAALGVLGPEATVAALVLDEEGAKRFAEGAPLVTDDRNLMEMRSAAIGRDASLSLTDKDPFEAFDPLVQPTPGIDRVSVVRRLLARGFEKRAHRVAEATPDPVERATAVGVVEWSTERPKAARQALEQALALDPHAAQARAARLRLERRSLIAGETSLDALLQDPSAREQAVVAGWKAEARADWSALRDLEPALAPVGRNDVLFEDAQRLRVRWRVESGDAQQAAEALPLVDALIPASNSARDEVLRARVLAVSGDAEGALVTLAQTGLNARMRSTGNRSVAREARRLRMRLGDESDPAAIEAAIRAALP